MEWLKKLVSPFTTNPLPKLRWFALMFVITWGAVFLPFTEWPFIAGILGTVLVSTFLLNKLYEKRSWAVSARNAVMSTTFYVPTAFVILTWVTIPFSWAAIFIMHYGIVVLSLIVTLAVAYKAYGLTKRIVFTTGAVCLAGLTLLAMWHYQGLHGVEILAGGYALTVLAVHARRWIAAFRAGARPSPMQLGIAAGALVVAGLAAFAIAKVGLYATIGVAGLLLAGGVFLLIRRRRALAAIDNTPRPSLLVRGVDSLVWFGLRSCIVAVPAALTVWLAVVNTNQSMMHYAMATALNPIEQTTIQNTKDDRLLPRYTAKGNIASSVHVNYAFVDKPQFEVRNGEAVFVGAIYRTEPWITTTSHMLRLDQLGFDMSYVVDVSGARADTVAREIIQTKSHKGFWLSDKNSLTKGIFALRHFGAIMGESTYVDNPDGTQVYLTPVVRWAPTWRLGMRPIVTGQMRADQQLKFDDIGLKQAARLYPGVQMIPDAVVREYAIAYGWYNSGLNDVLWNQDYVRVVAEDPTAADGQTNVAPYRQRLEDGSLWSVVTLKPHGDGGMTGVLLFSTTGEMHELKWPDGQFIAPSTAYEHASRAEWSGDRTNKRQVDPRIVVWNPPNGGQPKVYWLFTVVYGDTYAYVATIVVDAKTLTATALAEDKDIKAWFDNLHAGK